MTRRPTSPRETLPRVPDPPDDDGIGLAPILLFPQYAIPLWLIRKGIGTIGPTATKMLISAALRTTGMPGWAASTIAEATVFVAKTESRRETFYTGTTSGRKLEGRTYDPLALYLP